MADYSELIALIDANINDNHVQAITGPILNYVLKEMIQDLGYQADSIEWSAIINKPDTVDGYGITDAQKLWTSLDVDNSTTGVETVALVPGVFYNFLNGITGSSGLSLNLTNPEDLEVPEYKFQFSTDSSFNYGDTAQFSVSGVEFDETFQLDPGVTYQVSIVNGKGTVSRIQEVNCGYQYFYSGQTQDFVIVQPHESSSWVHIYLGDSVIFIALNIIFSNDAAPTASYEINLVNLPKVVRDAIGEIYLQHRCYPNVLTVNTMSDYNESQIRIKNISPYPQISVRELQTTIAIPRVRPTPRTSSNKLGASESVMHAQLQAAYEAAIRRENELKESQNIK